MSEEVLEQVISLIEKKMGRYRKPITRKTCLEKDLGMTGDDAVEFLLDYHKKYNVDLSKFDIRKYFMPEGDVFGMSSHKAKELTVGDLERGIIEKQLTDEMISQ
jgi:hypothetical protein